MQFDPMTILLLVLAAVGVWAVVELALTIRKAQSAFSISATVAGRAPAMMPRTILLVRKRSSEPSAR